MNRAVFRADFLEKSIVTAEAYKKRMGRIGNSVLSFLTVTELIIIK